MNNEQLAYYRNLLQDKEYMDDAARQLAKEYVEDLTKSIYSTEKERQDRYNLARNEQ